MSQTWKRRGRGAAIMAAILLAVGLSAGCGEVWESKGSGFVSGRELVTQGRYADAIPLLRGYIQDHPSGKHASRAHFFIAKAQIGLGDLTAARAAFLETIGRHPESLEAHKSRYKLGMIDFWEGDRAAARKRFAGLADRPDGSLAPEAKAMLDFLDGTDPED